MKILKNKIFWLMSFIVVLGILLRLIFIDKPDGLWNDEYTSWYIASVPLGKNFINAVFAQCHMPFYYFYLKFFIHFFGNSDLMLRLTSVLTGVLGIFGMYFVGNELKGKNLGILCAAITAISSYLIYFSQEVRLYSVLFLFAAFSLLFTLRLGRKQNLFNVFFYFLFNFLIMFTHTIGFVYVFFNMVFMSLWLLKTDKVSKKPILIGWSVILIIGLMLLPLIYSIFTAHTFSQWWGAFTVSKIGFLLTDYFSPVIINIVNAPDNFFFNFTFGFVIFALLPTTIACIGIIRALRMRQYKITGLFIVSLCYILVLIIMAVAGKLVFITKYSMEIYPILILLVSYGLVSIDNKKLGRVLIFLFVAINLFYVIKNPNSAPRMHRPQGHKIVAELLKHADLKKGDYILLNYYSQEKYEKYFNFKDYNVISINKGNFPDYLTSNVSDEESLKDGKKLYKTTFESPDNKYFSQKFDKELIDKLKPHQKITIIVLDSVALYSPIQIQGLVANSKEYKKAPLLFLVFSYMKNQELTECLKKLQIARYERKGSWAAITFVK